MRALVLLAFAWSLTLLAPGGGAARHHAAMAGEDVCWPSARHGAAVAFDPVGRQLMLFGGVNHLPKPERRFADTWALHAHGWKALDPGDRPAAGRLTPRIWAALAPDPTAPRMLLFGGLDTDGVRGDTWQWDGAHWSRLETRHRPPPRWHLAMAVDERRRQLVLFGGVDSTRGPLVHGDTWLWSGTDWVEAGGEGPSPRFGHAMAYDGERHAVVLVGGRDAAQRPLDDAWAWGGKRWARIEAGPGPCARLLHGLAFDPVRRTVLLFGGWDTRPSPEGFLADLWELDGATWRRLEVAGPLGRRAHAMASDPVRRRVLLYGGYTSSEVLDDLWQWDGITWVPGRRSGQARRWPPGPGA